MRNDYLIFSLFMGLLSVFCGVQHEIGLQVVFLIIQGLLLYKGVKQ